MADRDNLVKALTEPMTSELVTQYLASIGSKGGKAKGGAEMKANQLEKAASTAKLKPCPICDAPAVAIWKNCYLGCVVVCQNMACRCKVERQAVNCGPMRILRDALKAWNNR